MNADDPSEPPRLARVPPAADVVFAPIMASRAALEVADQITRAIAAGHYAIGDRLPIAAELARATGVSPPVVGEAFRLLREAGVIDVRRGSNGGATVLTADIPVAVRKLSRPRLATTLAEAVEARRPVEMAIARLAAVRATDEDLDELARLNDELVAARGQASRWRQAHNAFHYQMGNAARSGVLAYFQHDLLEEIALLLDDFDERYMDPERTIREHAETLAALRTRDPDVAAAVMDRHLEEFEEARGRPRGGA